MDREKLFEAMGALDDELILQAAPKEEKAKMKNPRKLFILAIAAVLVLGLTVGAGAVGLPFVSGLFRQHNEEHKVAVGTYVDTYQGVQQVGSAAESENAGGMIVTAQEAYSDGEYIHVSFTLDDPENTLKDCYDATLNTSWIMDEGPMPIEKHYGEGDVTQEFWVNLEPLNGHLEGTVSLKLAAQVDDGQVLNIGYRSDKILARYDMGGSTKEIPASFNGSLLVTVDKSHNQVVPVSTSQGEVEITRVESTPSYTKISFEAPFWGYTDVMTNYPRLFLPDGTELRHTWTEEAAADAQIITDENGEAVRFAATHLYDGLPNGTQEVILRFADSQSFNDGTTEEVLDSDGAPYERKIGILAEVTIDLASGKATPTETYLEAGFANAAENGYYTEYAELGWHVGFDVLKHQAQLSDYPELFSHNLTLETLDVVGGKGFSLLFLSTKDSMDKDYQVTVTGENGAVLAQGNLDRSRVTPYVMLTQYDSMEEMLDDLEKTVRSEYPADFYSEELIEEEIRSQQEAALFTREGEYYNGVKLEYTGQPVPLLSHLTVAVTDPDTGEEVYSTTLRLERKEFWNRTRW